MRERESERERERDTDGERERGNLCNLLHQILITITL